MRLLAFFLALLLLAGAVDATEGWLITLVVITGLAAFRPSFWRRLELRPRLDLSLASFVLAVLLLAGVVDANREWLIALSVVTGIAAFMPGIVSLGGHGRRDGWDWEWAWSEPKEWRRNRRAVARRTNTWGDEWS